ncbi:MAG: cytochrome c3 family protein [Coriobacteriia bacterium]|nr:cytochrome c3 family protein [Coriobacteriia bacterium]
MSDDGGSYEGRQERPAPRPRRSEHARAAKRRSKAPKRSKPRSAPRSATPPTHEALRASGPHRRRSPVPLIAIVLLVVIVPLAVGLVATSSAGLCTRSCHSVHGDDVAAFEQSTHQRASCVTCHVDAEAGALGRFAYRLGKLGDYGPMLFGSVEQPVNAMSEVALSMSSGQCTQCHVMDRRRVTPSVGIVIDHAVHEAAGIGCTACHNRVAHPETAITLEIEGNAPKQDFMSMTACYRCHSLGEAWASEYRASGECVVCHTAGFDLIPPSHDAEDWYTERGASAGHAAAYTAALDRAATAQASPAEGAALVRVPPVAAVNECYTCHLAAYCTGCHGTQIPHPDGFTATHGQEFTTADADGCAKCHNKTGAEANDRYACTLCHHPGFNPAEGAWRKRHDDVIAGGVSPLDSCYGCHDETYCSSCHVRGEPSTPY